MHVFERFACQRCQGHSFITRTPALTCHSAHHGPGYHDHEDSDMVVQMPRLVPSCRWPSSGTSISDRRRICLCIRKQCARGICSVDGPVPTSASRLDMIFAAEEANKASISLLVDLSDSTFFSHDWFHPGMNRPCRDRLPASKPAPWMRIRDSE